MLYSEKYRSGPRGRKDSDTFGKIYVRGLSVYSGTRAMDRDLGTVDAAELKVQMSLRSEHGKEEIVEVEDLCGRRFGVQAQAHNHEIGSEIEA